MLNLFKTGVYFSLIIFFSTGLNAQKIIKNFHKDSLTNEQLLILKSNFGKHKTIPQAFENQILIALSYFPELKDTKIDFKLKNRTTPLATRPTFLSMFRSAKKRTYVITISKKSTNYLDAIVLKNIGYNAQIGVLGHELSHVSDYLNKGFGEMFTVATNEVFSKKKIDKFEFNTDLNCINHGLGYQLLDWSIQVRENLKRNNWLGAINLMGAENNERYMNPATIINILDKHHLYKDDEKNTVTTQISQD
ncbi:MAG: hypothetical protein RQ864_00865 [Lutibacter sp.]|nr:hypothetical protein [Lutibacter sp.]